MVRLLPRSGRERALEAVNGVLRARVRELEGQNRALVEKANTDNDTGLPNLTTLREDLRRELDLTERRTERRDRSASVIDDVAVIFIDVNGFKGINDTYGHNDADALVVRLSEVISGAVRHTDRVYRRSGDEFVVMLPGTGVDGAHEALAKINEAIAKDKTLDDHGVTVAAGVASMKDSTHRTACSTVNGPVSAIAYPTANDLLDVADERMREAKGEMYSSLGTVRRVE